MKSLFRNLIVVVFAIALLSIPAVSTWAQGARSGAPQQYGSYLKANDMIDVKVFQEDDLQATLRVSKDGTITFPLIGTVRVAGKTAQEAARIIRDRLAQNYLVNPQVSVTVREFAKKRFTVLGEVQRPGAYDLPDHEQLGLLEAIGMAGGYTRIAEPARITLKRRVNGRETIIKVNAKSMAKDSRSRSMEIMPGDVVTVGERIF